MSDNNVQTQPGSLQNVSSENNQRPLKTYNTFYIYSACINVCLGALFFGYVMSAFNPIQAFVQPHGFKNPVAKILITLMTSFVPLGAALGAITAGKIANAFGRRKPIMAIDGISIIGTVLTLIPSEYSLLVGRLIQGYCVGANSSLVPLYINEMAPTEITGRLGTANQFFISFGILVTPLLGLGMPQGTGESNPDSQYFRVILGIAGVFPVLRILLSALVFRYDTPNYLLDINKEGTAMAALRKIYIGSRAQDELNILKEKKAAQARSGKVTMKEIVSKKYRKRLIVGVTVALLQQLSGINAVIFFSNAIFSVGDNKGTILPTVYTIVYAVIQVLAVFVAGAIIERLGRRIMLIGGMLFSAIVLAVFGILTILDPETPAGKFLIWAFVLGFGLSLGPLPWIYVSDILPDLGIGIAALVNWIAVFVIGLVFPYVADDGGTGWGFIFFAVCSLLGFVFMLFYVKETNGKNEAQIAAMFGYKGDASEPGRVENADIQAMKVNKQFSEALTMKSSPTDDDLERARNLPTMTMLPIVQEQVAIEVR